MRYDVKYAYKTANGNDITNTSVAGDETHLAQLLETIEALEEYELVSVTPHRG